MYERARPLECGCDGIGIDGDNTEDNHSKKFEDRPADVAMLDEVPHEDAEQENASEHSQTLNEADDGVPRGIKLRYTGRGTRKRGVGADENNRGKQSEGNRQNPG